MCAWPSTRKLLEQTTRCEVFLALLITGRSMPMRRAMIANYNQQFNKRETMRRFEQFHKWQH